MSESETRGLQFDEEERLPWLESGDAVDEGDGVSVGRLFGLVIAGLALIGAIVGGLWWWQNNAGRPRSEIIAAPAGPVRVAPPEERGRFDGDGNAAVAAAEGVRTTGQVDPSQLPEAPVAPPAATGRAAPRPESSTPVNRPTQTAQAQTPAAAPAAARTTARPAAAGTSASAPVRSSTAPAPGATRGAAPAAAPATGGMIQLGAFASEATANRAWSGLKERFTWLAPVNASVASAEVNGRTVYRLRAAAGSSSNARNLCNRLRVAGENCIVL